MVSVIELALELALVLAVAIWVAWYVRYRRDIGPFAIVYDEATREVSFPRISQISHTPSGALVSLRKADYLVDGRKHAWTERGRRIMRILPAPDVTYYTLLAGNPAPIEVHRNDAAPVSMSAAELHGAIRSRIADRILRPGLDPMLIAVIVIGMVAAVAVIALVTRR